MSDVVAFLFVVMFMVLGLLFTVVPWVIGLGWMAHRWLGVS